MDRPVRHHLTRQGLIPVFGTLRNGESRDAATLVPKPLQAVLQTRFADNLRRIARTIRCTNSFSRLPASALLPLQVASCDAEFWRSFPALTLSDLARGKTSTLLSWRGLVKTTSLTQRAWARLNSGGKVRSLIPLLAALLRVRERTTSPLATRSAYLNGQFGGTPRRPIGCPPELAPAALRGVGTLQASKDPSTNLGNL